jgi:hypothetical protein
VPFYSLTNSVSIFYFLFLLFIFSSHDPFLYCFNFYWLASKTMIGSSSRMKWPNYPPTLFPILVFYLNSVIPFFWKTRVRLLDVTNFLQPNSKEKMINSLTPNKVTVLPIVTYVHSIYINHSRARQWILFFRQNEKLVRCFLSDFLRC